MIKVKEFDEIQAKRTLSEQINEFVEKEKVKVIDVKYCTNVVATVRGGQLSAPEMYQVIAASALLIYEESIEKKMGI